METEDIYSYVLAQEASMDNDIDLNGWQWNFKKHVQTTFKYKHGRLINGNDDYTPVMNVIRRMLFLQYTAEDIDVKDVMIYVDNPDDYHLSFLVKKYHDDVFIPENDLDTFFDEIKESKVDYGGGLAKKIDKARPDVVPLESIAFCDQTDMLAGPIGFKLFFSPDQLKDTAEMGWGEESNGATITLDELIELSTSDKQINKDSLKNQTSGRNIEVYEIHGALPESYLFEGGDPDKFVYQFQIIAYYKTKEGKKIGVTLFRKKQKRGNLKLLLRDKIYSRCLGFGGAEELFESQVWTNYGLIKKKEMFDAAITILSTDDDTLAAKHPNGLKGMNNMEIITRAPNTTIGQVDTYPRNMAVFDKWDEMWDIHAQRTSSATDALLGENPTAGTPFKLQDLLTVEGKSLHEYRKEKFARFLKEVYTDWIIPYIIDAITKGVKFLSELSADEMQYIVDCVVRNQLAEYQNNRVLSGELPLTEQEQEAFKQKVRDDFTRGGNKRFIEILKGEFKSKKLRVKINIAGTQSDTAKKTDRLSNIFRQIFANPQAFLQMMQIPELAKMFSQIIEFSGFSPVSFAGFQYKQLPQQPAQQPIQSPIQGQQPLQVNQ